MWYDHIRIISGILGQNTLENLSMLLVKPGRLNIPALCPSDMKSSVRKWHGRKQGRENRRKEGHWTHVKQTVLKMRGECQFCCSTNQAPAWQGLAEILGKRAHAIVVTSLANSSGQLALQFNLFLKISFETRHASQMKKPWVLKLNTDCSASSLLLLS